MGITGTTYEQKKDNNGEKKNIHKRYYQCPVCHNKVYSNSENFQELLKEELSKKKIGNNKKKKNK